MPSRRRKDNIKGIFKTLTREFGLDSFGSGLGQVEG